MNPSLSEALGVACGFAAAPLFAATSFLRRARTFHPRGDLYVARVSAEKSPAYEHLATRLTGSALVRFSGALWKHAETFDVLGCALRFRSTTDVATTRAPTDQDLLLATIQRPWTMGLAPFFTNPHDYLGNDYFAVSPFEAPGVRRISFRLRPERVASDVEKRGPRLDEAVVADRARLHLEGAPGPWGPWEPIVRIDLLRRVVVDDAALRFDPFADGRGLRPVGFVHALRRGVYLMSQLARPSAR